MQVAVGGIDRQQRPDSRDEEGEGEGIAAATPADWAHSEHSGDRTLIDPTIRSEGRADLKSGTRFQFTSTQMTPAKETELSRKHVGGTSIGALKAATTRPPRAGPTARARLLS